MNRFAFNGLVRGDVVHVHQSPTTQHHGDADVVAFVHNVARGDNDVGIRIGDGAVLWPSRFVVHPEAVASAGECWRCDEPSVLH